MTRRFSNKEKDVSKTRTRTRTQTSVLWFGERQREREKERVAPGQVVGRPGAGRGSSRGRSWVAGSDVGVFVPDMERWVGAEVQSGPREREMETGTNKLKHETKDPYFVDEDDFFTACEEQKHDIIDRYLSIKGDVNARDAFERTALHRAAFRGHAEVVSKLLESGADVTATDKLDTTCLHAACRGGNPAVLRMLLQKGANITALDKLDSTPLHVSVRAGHQSCTELLIQSGASVNSQDKVTHDAVRLNRTNMIQLLLRHGAHRHLTNTVQNQDRPGTEPGPTRYRTRTDPVQNQDRPGTEQGPTRYRTRTNIVTGLGLDQD
uniref:Uncharacterized protein n=1 Tax=Periophthalmus magnuspinnatus TaxID=409849 RepID=A0A3B4AEF8_9GOBI